MKLVSVTVKNFRSITDAYKIPVGDLAVLVGPNNEGKSNVLKAIVLALALIAKPRVAMSGTRVRFRAATDDLLAYDWQRDFPVSLQQVRADGRSEIVLEFSMSTPEANAFRQATGLNLNKNLKLAVLPGIDDNLVELKLQGQAKSKMTPDQFVAITKFVAGRINIQYIPTVRSSDTTEAIVADLMASELRRLEDKPEYLKLLDDLESAQRPLLEQLGAELTATVRTFVPEVRQISIIPAVRRAVSRSASIQVDDGADTLLALKGDGVKSLAAMSLMRHVSQKSAKGRSMIFAVEEPESHLHPDAIHRLRQVLLDISQDNQVVLTTHSPSLVDRVNPSCNVIVRAGKAIAAASLRDVRDALGVRLSDNLSSARLALLVEGESDRRILARLLGDLHADLKRMIDSGELVLDVLRGASNLRSKLGFHRAHICQTHTFLDNDDEGRLALKEAQDSDLVPDSEYHVATAKGMKNSELEDLLKPASYRAAIETELRVTLDESALSATTRKWGERMKDQLVAGNGKVWTPKLEQRIKTIVADQVQSAGLEALHPARKSVVVQLAGTIKARLMVN